MQTTILVSRFPDSLTPGALPLAEEFDREFERSRVAEIPADPEMVTITPHRMEPGRWLVVEWVRDPVVKFRQLGTPPTNVPSIENGREYVPPGAELRYRGPWGEAWVVPARAVRA